MKEQVVVKMMFGSHLYGTNTPNSDTDYKGVFLPTRDQIFLGNIPKSYNNAKKKPEGQKNSQADVDMEAYSLHYFIKLACEGQTVALDMLHAPTDMVEATSNIWLDIVANRERFYTKNLKAFVGYARRQVSKYGIKGSRLNAAASFVETLNQHDSGDKMAAVWEKIPLGEHCHIIRDAPSGIPQVQVCGKIFQKTASVGYVQSALKKFHDAYGARAKLAAENKGIDFKAISHAFRAAFQVKQLLTENTITFPLKEAYFLTKVKTGELDYMTECAPRLEDLMEEVETLSAESDLPEKPDRKFWNNFIIDTISNNLI